jgi:hypothetical protein
LKQLYDEAPLKQIRYTLHAVCVHEGSAALGHFWTYVYHVDRQKWYRYNDNDGRHQRHTLTSRTAALLVCETTWNDVFDAGLGGHRATNDRDEPRASSAYLLVYINADDKSLFTGNETFTMSACSFDRCVGLDVPHFELSTDLQRILDDDLLLLQQQIESVKLEQLHSDLKSVCEHMEKQQTIHRASTIPFFAGPNAPSGKIAGICAPSISITGQCFQIPNWSNQFSTRHYAFSKPMRREYSR